MKRIFATFIFLLALIIEANAQITFQKTFDGNGGEGAYSVQQTSDGGYIIFGGTNSFGAGDADFYLIKTDAIGDLIWTKTYGGAGSDYSKFGQQTLDGGYVITGSTNSFGAGGHDVYMIKTDANGDSLWTKTFGGIDNEHGYSIRLTSDGGYIIAGYTTSFGTGSADVYLIKTDANGDSLWTKTIGGTGVNWGFSVEQTTDGGFIIAGWTSNFGAGGNDICLIKTDPNGSSLWTRTFGGMDHEGGNSVKQTTDGGYIITGYASSFGAGLSDVYLIRTDGNGDTLWTKTFGGTNVDGGNFIQQAADGGYIIIGQTKSFGTGGYDIYLIKTDTNGDSLWTKTFGGIGDDGGFSVHQSTDGGYVIVGYSANFATVNAGVYFTKTDSLGNSGCNQGNTATIITTPATQVTSPATIVTSPATIVTNPATNVGSGGIVSTLCTTVGIQSEIQNPKSEITISPNPASNTITISNPQSAIEAIEIYNVMGQKVFSQLQTVNYKLQTVTIDVSTWNKGIYFIKVSDGEKQVVKKVVIQK